MLLSFLASCVLIFAKSRKLIPAFVYETKRTKVVFKPNRNNSDKAIILWKRNHKLISAFENFVKTKGIIITADKILITEKVQALDNFKIFSSYGNY